jgi:hypothetical protein
MDLSKIIVKVDGNDIKSGWLDGTGKKDKSRALYTSGIKSAFGTVSLIDQGLNEKGMDALKVSGYAESRLPEFMESHEKSQKTFTKKFLKDEPGDKFQGITKIIKKGCCGSEMIRKNIEVYVLTE